MASISGVIPNVIGGMSQQPPASRLENTAGDLKNAIPSVVSGLRKRPPMQYISSLFSTPTSNIAFYMFDRPGKEQKFVVVYDDTIKVFDTDGNEETVTISGAAGNYITTSTPRDTLGFLSIGDSVMIYNRDVTVAVTNAAETRDDPEDQVTMIVENTAGGADFTFSVGDMGGSYQTGTFTTNATTPEDPDKIANRLKNSFNSDGSLSLTATRRGNLVFATGVSAYNDVINEPGSLTTMYRGVIDKFTKLPPQEKPGRLVKVDPNGEDSGDDSYWVQYDRTKRVWNEVVGYDAHEALDASTMPHVLRDNGDGTWTFAVNTWDGRTVGDVDSNPSPSFVGFEIKHMFTTANRLCILSDENLIASEVGNFENFYRTTCTVLLDSDRLDIAALSTESRVAKLYHAIDFDDYILLFSDKTQFKLDNTDGLSPSTVSLKATTSFNTATQVSPVKAGTNILFIDDQNNSSWADVREYMVDNVVGVNTSEIITKQVPEFLPSGIHKMITNDSLGLVLAFPTGTARDHVYLYSYYFAENQRIQAAWSYWYDKNSLFHDGAFDGNLLYLLVEREGEIILTKMALQETVSGDVEGLEIMLDYRTQPVSITFDGVDSTVQMPYDLIDTESYVAVLLTDGVDKAGTAYPASSINTTTNTLTFTGVDLSAETLYVGQTYEFVYELSPIFLRDQGKVPIQDGRLQIRYISLLYHQTSYFEVDVDIPGRDTWTKTFTGRTMGALYNIVGDVAVVDGEFRVPVSSEASKVTITIRNASAFNCRFSSIEWEGVWRPRTKRMR